MTRDDVAELLGRSPDDPKVEFLVRGQFSREEIEALDKFGTGVSFGKTAQGEGELLEETRDEVLARFLKECPTLGESEFRGWMQTYWDDGLKGPHFAKLLQREPEDQ